MKQEEPGSEFNELSYEIIGAAMEVHTAQVITYLKMTQKRLGLLMNFNVPIMKQGIRRIIL